MAGQKLTTAPNLTGGQATVQITNICDRHNLILSTLVLSGPGFQQVKRLARAGLKPGETKTFNMEVPSTPRELRVQGTMDQHSFHTTFSPLRLGTPQIDRKHCLEVMVSVRAAPSRVEAFLSTNKGCLEEGQKAVYALGERVEVNFRVEVSGQCYASLTNLLPDGRTQVLLQRTIAGGRKISLGGTAEEPSGERTLRLTAWQSAEAAEKGDNPIAQARCSYLVEGEPQKRCDCGSWNDRDHNDKPDVTVDGYTVNSGGTVTLSLSNLPITLSPGYICQGDCAPDYSWYVNGPGGFTSSGSHVSSPFDLTPYSLNGTGTYTVTVVSHCNGKDCARLQFKLRVEEETKPSITVNKLVSSDLGETWREEVSQPVCQNVHFKIVVKNTGNRPVENIHVSDSLPGGLEFNPGSANYSHGGSLSNPTWHIPGPLEPGDSIVITFSAHVGSDGTHRNCAKIHAESNEARLEGGDCAVVYGETGQCQCGEWSEINVEYSSGLSAPSSNWRGHCGDTIRVTHAQAAHQIAVSSSIRCINYDSVKPVYSWNVTSPGIGTWNSGDGNQCIFSTSSFDQATAILHATCGDTKCPPCNLFVEYTEGEPDLVVDNVQFDKKCNLKITICNTGTIDVTDSFSLFVSPVENQGTGSTGWRESLNGLAAGACVTRVLEQPVFLDTGLSVTVDPENTIEEDNKSNNHRTFSVPEECLQAECECGDWTGATVEGDKRVPCGQIIQLSPDQIQGPVTIEPHYTCVGDCPPDSLKLYWEVWRSGSLFTDSGTQVPPPIEFTPDSPGEYRVKMEPTCDNKSCCEPCVIRIDIQKQECKCGQWTAETEAPTGAAVDESAQVAVTTGGGSTSLAAFEPGETSLHSCDDTITLDPGGQVVALTSTMNCEGSNCRVTYTTEVIAPDGSTLGSNQYQTPDSHTVTLEYDSLSPGVYTVVFNAACDGVKCPPCRIFVKVGERCTCPDFMEYNVCREGDDFRGPEGPDPSQKLIGWVNDNYAPGSDFFYPDNPRGCNKLKGCDEKTENRYWAHTFHFPVSAPHACQIESATLKMRVHYGDENDSLKLGFISGGGSWVWSEDLSVQGLLGANAPQTGVIKT